MGDCSSGVFRTHMGCAVKNAGNFVRLAGHDGAETRVLFINEYASPGRAGRVVDWMLTRHALARRNREYLERLARLAERRA